MFFRVMLFVWTFVLDVAAVSGMADEEKDLEILLLRQQLRIVERKQSRGPRIPHPGFLLPCSPAVQWSHG
jgi:hypothetical protein